MDEPIDIRLPSDAISTIAVLLIVLPFVAQFITAQIIRRRPDISSADRFSLSVAVSFALMLVVGWGTLIALGYSELSFEALLLVLPACFTVSGGKEVVYRVGLEFWQRMTKVPPPPDEPLVISARNDDGSNTGTSISLSRGGPRTPDGEV
jgi:hypothetical protein